jgi:hypothetical protein
MILLIAASWIPEITGVSHHAWPLSWVIYRSCLSGPASLDGCVRVCVCVCVCVCVRACARVQNVVTSMAREGIFVKSTSGLLPTHLLSIYPSVRA